MLQNEVELLQTNDENVFGQKFNNHLTKLNTVKVPFNVAVCFKKNSIRTVCRSKLLEVIEATKQR